MTTNETETLRQELKRELAQYREEVRKEAQSQFAKWVVGLVALLIAAAAAGWIAILKPSLVAYAGGVPAGFVVADANRATTECPKGWTELQETRGRTIIGSGHGDGLQNRPHGIVGGSESHALTELEMPSHSHTYQSMRPTASDEDGLENNGKARGEHLNQPTKSEASGGGQAHNNMQPFIAYRYCMKQ